MDGSRYCICISNWHSPKHAVEEFCEYAELHGVLQGDERAFRYSCKAPQWARIAGLIGAEKERQGQGIRPEPENES